MIEHKLVLPIFGYQHGCAALHSLKPCLTAWHRDAVLARPDLRDSDCGSEQPDRARRVTCVVGFLGGAVSPIRACRLRRCTACWGS